MRSLNNTNLVTLIGTTLWWLPFNTFWSILIINGLQIRVEKLVEYEVAGRALGWLCFVGAIVSTVTQLIVAPISDAIPFGFLRRRFPLLLGTALTFPFILSFLFAGDFLTLVLNFAIIQFTMNCAAASFQALIPDILPQSRHGIASAYMAMWALVGNFIGMAASWAVLGRVSGDKVWMALAHLMTFSWIFAMIVAILTAFLVREPGFSGENPKNLAKKIPAIMSFKEVIEHHSFMWLFISRFLIQMGVYGSLPFLRWYVQDTILSQEVVVDTALIGICAMTGSAVSIFPAGKIADRYSKRLIIFISCSIAILGGVIFICAHSLYLAMVAAAILGAGFGAFSAVDWALACNLVPKEWAAKFMAVFHIAFTLPQATSGIIGGFIGDFGNKVFGKGVGWRLVFAMCIIYFAIGSWLIRKVSERQVEKAANFGT